MCKKCEIKPVYEFTNKRKLCKRCFINYFQKKVLYIIRKFKMARTGNIIGYENKKDFRNAVLKDVLKIYAEKANAKLVASAKNADKKANSTTLDFEAGEIISEIINGNAEKMNKRVSPVEDKNKNKIIKPLYLFLDEEVLLYAKLRGVKFKKSKEKKDKIGKFISELEKKHPEIKRAIINGMLKACGK